MRFQWVSFCIGWTSHLQWICNKFWLKIGYIHLHKWFGCLRKFLCMSQWTKPNKCCPAIDSCSGETSTSKTPENTECINFCRYKRIKFFIYFSHFNYFLLLFFYLYLNYPLSYRFICYILPVIFYDIAFYRSISRSIIVVIIFYCYWINKITIWEFFIQLHIESYLWHAIDLIFF